MTRLSHHHIRRQSVINWHTALAQKQGFSSAEARTRAIAQEDFDEALTARQLTIAEGLSASGWQPSDWSRICSGAMPTRELTALVGYARRLPHDGSMPSYVRHGWTAGAHGLF